MKLDLDDVTNPTDSPDLPDLPDRSPAFWQRPGIIAAGLVLALAAGGLTVRSLTRPPEPLPLVRMPIPLPEGQMFTPGGQRGLAISPNGRHVAYSANGIWLRPVDQLQATPIPGTGDGGFSNAGRAAFFSPDGRWLGYWQQGQIRKVAISGGAPVALGDVERGIAGGSWGEDDAILFGRMDGGVWRVPGTGGTPEQVIAVEASESARAPQMLPGGEWVLFSLLPNGRSTWDEALIVAQSLATGERRILIEGGRDARYVSTGHLVYFLNNVLFAVPFDAGTLAVTGGPVSLVEDVRGSVMFGAADFDLSDTGSLVYLPAVATGSQQVNLVWVDRTGTADALGIEPGSHGLARVSPDGTRLAIDGDGDIWIYELSRNTLTRLTFDEAIDDRPLWSPDGSRVVFSSTRGEGGLFWRAADGTGGAERLLEGANAVAGGWTPDGQLAFSQGGNIAMLTIGGERTATPLLATEFEEDAVAVSPDGRWLVYRSDESGEAEVYVRPFPDVESGKWQVSNGGGNYPVWSPDGREIFFSTTVGGFGSFMAARVETEPTFRTLMPERLFGLEAFADAVGREWDVAPDGERFLFRVAAASPNRNEAVLNGVIFVQGWFEELKARVPVP